MDFHDYLNEKCNLIELAERATALGEVLEARFEQEDKLIEILHLAHKRLVENS